MASDTLKPGDQCGLPVGKFCMERQQSSHRQCFLHSFGLPSLSQHLPGNPTQHTVSLQQNHHRTINEINQITIKDTKLSKKTTSHTPDLPFFTYFSKTKNLKKHHI